MVLGYHRVVNDFSSAMKASIPSMLISRRMFERHLDSIGRRFRYVPLEAVEATVVGQGRRFGGPTAAITFDDGYRDFYHFAFPILKKKGIPAAVFVVTDFISAPHLLPHDQLYRLLCQAFSQWPRPYWRLVCVLQDLGITAELRAQFKTVANNPFGLTRLLLTRLPQREIVRITETLSERLQPADDSLEDFKPLTCEMLAEMVQSGMTIGSHTRTHILLTNESPGRVHEELEGSRHDLESRLGVPIHRFAYPDGHFDSRTVQAVAAAGYRFAYTTCRHRDPNYPVLTIPRTLLWENSCLDSRGGFSPAVMNCQMTGLFSFLACCDQDHYSPGSASGPVRMQESKSMGVAQ